MGKKSDFNPIFFLLLPVFLLTMCGKKSHEPKLKSENTSIPIISVLLDSALQNSNNRKAEKQILKAYNLAKSSHNDSLILGVLETESQLDYRNGEKDIFKKKNVQISKQAHQKRLYHIEAKSLFNIGNYYFEQSRYDSAYFYYTQSKDASITVKDYKRISSNMVNMAIIQTTVGDYNGSEQTSIEGLKITPDSCKNIKLSFYNNLGVISDELGDYKESLLWYDKALRLSEDSLQKLVFLNNMALVYKNENNFSKALYYLHQAEQMSDKNKFPDYDAMVHDNLGYIMHKNHEINALETMLAAYSERHKTGDISGLIASELHLSEYWSDHANPVETENYALRALQNTYRVKDVKNRLKILSLLSKNFPHKGYVGTYIILNDSVTLADRKWKNQLTKIKYRTEEKDKENTDLKSENLNQKLLLQKQSIRNLITGFVIILLFIFVCSLLLYLYQSKKIQKQKLRIEKLKAQEEEKNKIAMLLHDDLASDLLLGLQKGEQLQRNNADKELSVLLDYFETAYEKLRKTSQGFSTVDFDKISFEKKIHSLAYEYQNAVHMHIDIQNIDIIDWQRCAHEMKLSLYRIIQEAFNNTMKHSDASYIKVAFGKSAGRIMINITDDGTLENGKDAIQGVGLSHMQARVKELGGTIQIGQKQTGWELRLEIPFEYE